jgi:hypothetical protein
MRAVASIPPSEPELACPRLAQCAQVGTPADLPQRGRALVPVGFGPGTAVDDPTGSRPSAVFLAQLIATAQQAPQTRRRRRAEPNEVSILYTAVSAPTISIGRAICRSM